MDIPKQWNKNSRFSSNQNKILKTKKSNGFCNSKKLYILAILFGIGCSTIFLFIPSLNEDTRFSMEDLENKFPSQPKDLWDALEAGVEDVGTYGNPVTYILLYNETTEVTAIELVKDMARYSLCILKKNCFSEPILLNGFDLYREMGDSDYGLLVAKYKPELEEKVTMIMFDLQGLSGNLAQCFHTMCDEYSPLVGKTVYFFTIKIDATKNSSKSVDAIVEAFLRENWEDIKDHLFYPLYTRISNMIFTVVPEN